MLKKLNYLIFFLLIFFFIGFKPAQAADKVNLYFFYGAGCPHCAKEEKFLKKFYQDNENINIHYFEIYNSSDNRDLYIKVGRELGIDTKGVPLLIVGEKSFAGYYDDETTGAKIKTAVDGYIKNGCVDIVGPIIGIKPEQTNPGSEQAAQEEDCQANTAAEGKITVPFLGEVNPRNFSLPILTIVLAGIDGFNPCAMWVLLFLINLLLGMEDRLKMWVLGSAFILSSAVVYFVFLAAWLNVVLFMGFLAWIRTAIALAALISGGYYIYDYFKNHQGVCKVAGQEKKREIFARLKKIALEEKFLMALIGIIVLAGLVNLVELLCSAGIPATYVPILTLAHLPAWQYYCYLILYIFIYMLDDLLVFIFAMVTLQTKVFGASFARWSGLIGGIIMIIIGMLLLFKPGWLMFG